MRNKSLVKAKINEDDEYYTRLDDIEAEISCHQDYVKHFKNKTVFCNCDDPEYSNFYEFFRLHFKQLGLKKLITTHYITPKTQTIEQPILMKNGKPKKDKNGNIVMETIVVNEEIVPSYKLEWSGEMLGDDTVNMIKTPLQGNGDFRSEECAALMDEADIIVTNPPFSLFTEYISLLLKKKKKFIILGNTNAITYKEVFPLIKNGEIFIGYKSSGADMYFIVSDEHAKTLVETKNEKSGYVYINGKVYGRTQAIWYTNLDIDKTHEPMPLTKNYKGNEREYPKYETIDGIDVSMVKNIPKDYFGIMGVPKTFIDQYCVDQFDIIGFEREDENIKCGIKNFPEQFLKDYKAKGGTGHYTKGMKQLCFYDKNGNPKVPFSRILIRRKK